MLQGHSKHKMFGLEVEQFWDACESTSLEAKEFGEQVTYGLQIYLASE